MLRLPPMSTLFPYTTLFRSQLESARPYTMTTPFDVNGDGVANDRAVVNGVQTTLDEFRTVIRHSIAVDIDRKSTRLNSSHANTSYAVSPLKPTKSSSSCSTH